MSTIKVNNLVPPNVGETVSINGLDMPTAGALSNRNRWINGAMTVDQRRSGTSKTNAGNGDYVVDRLKLECPGAANSKCTIGQNLNSVTPPAGFKNYAGLQVTSTYSIASNQHINISRWLEGYNVSDFDLGTANAKKFTVSFWVRSSVAGTYGLSVLGYDGASTFRHLARAYTMDSANTWEYKTVTIQGDIASTITWNTTNGTGLFIEWNLAAGASLQATENTWSTGLKRSIPNQTNLFATNGATFYLTGVQLEVGEKATPFEHRSYGDELARCQRYFQKHHEPRLRGVGGGSANCNRMGMTLPVTMRQAPSSTSTGTFGWYDGNNVGTINYFTTTYNLPDSVELDSANSGTNPNAMTGTTTATNATVVYNSNNAQTGDLLLDAEL